jgi:hypothetical protein
VRFADARPAPADGSKYLHLSAGAIIAESLRDLKWSRPSIRTGIRKSRGNPAKRRAKDAAYGGYKMTRAMWLRHERQAKLFVPWNELTAKEKRKARNARKTERRELR